MAVHNGQRYLESAMRSVMTQTLSDIEILVVDDASTDDTPDILARLAKEDRRIRIERLEDNRRLPGALNHGMELARGDYVARMDADDLCERRRLEVQADYLEDHPEITLVGCSVVRIDGDGQAFQTSLRPQTPYLTRWMCRFVMPFRHPTFMFRRADMMLKYDPSCTVSEDYDILARLTESHQVACLPEPLLRYREHSGSLTGKKWRKMLSEARAIALKVQAADMSPRVFRAMSAFRSAYFDLQALDEAGTAALFEGLRSMAREDAAASPRNRAWIWRQTSQLAAQALMRSGAANRDIMRAFAGPGRDFLPALSLRFLETRQMLPEPMRSDPNVWQPHAGWEGPLHERPARRQRADMR